MESNLDSARQIGITLAEDERIRSVLIGMRADLNNVERFGMRAQDADQAYAQIFQWAILGVMYQALERGLIAIPAPAQDAPMPATGEAATPAQRMARDLADLAVFEEIANLRERLINFRVRAIQYQGALRYLQTFIQLAADDPRALDGEEWETASAVIRQELGLEGEAE